MSTNCVITLDHPNCVYTSGDTLNGHVSLRTEKSMSIRAILIKVIGIGTVSWSKAGSPRSTHFTGEQQYLNSVTYVIGSAGGNSFDLEAGIYEYTFTCDLPNEVPSSMKDKIGKIKYKVIVTIDRPLRFDNVFKQEFIVHHKLNLNLNLNDKLPNKCTGFTEIAPFFGCCCLTGTKIKAELQIPCSGYVAGQNIPFQLIVYNDSNIDLSGAKVELIKCYTYLSQEPYEREKETEKVLDFKNCDKITRHTNKEFKNTVLVPFLPATQRTRLITFNYKLKATIKVFGYSTKKFYVEVPIILGTIPFADFEPK